MPPPVVIIAGGAILLFAVLFVWALFRGSKGFEAERAKLLQEFSNRQGFTFHAEDIFGLRERIRAFGAIGFANNQVVQAAHHQENDTDYFLFDQMKVSMSGAAQGGYYTICLAERRRPFGMEMVINEVDNRLAAKMSRSMAPARTGLAVALTHDQAFDDRFVVFAAHPGQAATYLTPAVRRLLLDRAGEVKANLVVQVASNRLAVHNAGQGVRTISSVAEMEALYLLAQGLVAAW